MKAIEHAGLGREINRTEEGGRRVARRGRAARAGRAAGGASRVSTEAILRPGATCDVVASARAS